MMCLSKGLGAVQFAMDEGLLPRRKLAFIPTAGEVYENPYFVEESRQRLRLLGLELVEMNVSAESSIALKQLLDEVDGLYLSGGNSFYLLDQLKKKDLVAEIRSRVQAGMPYFGESAGAVVLSESIELLAPIDDPKLAPELTEPTALGLIDFLPLPHFDREKYQPLFTHFYEENRDKAKIIPFNDDQALLIRDGGEPEVLASALQELF